VFYLRLSLAVLALTNLFIVECRGAEPPPRLPGGGRGLTPSMMNLWDRTWPVSEYFNSEDSGPPWYVILGHSRGALCRVGALRCLDPICSDIVVALFYHLVTNGEALVPVSDTEGIFFRVEWGGTCYWVPADLVPFDATCCDMSTVWLGKLYAAYDKKIRPLLKSSG
jgi:hypothetical protein